MKFSKMFFSLLAISAVSGAVARAHSECYTDCWYDSWGNRHCRTECRPHHHHPAPPPVVVVDPDKNDLAISASILAISATTLAMQDDDKQVLVNAAEDAAAYFENGKMSGTLAALVQLARENAAKVDADAAAKLSEAQLVDGILSAAEQALDLK